MKTVFTIILVIGGLLLAGLSWNQEEKFNGWTWTGVGLMVVGILIMLGTTGFGPFKKK